MKFFSDINLTVNFASGNKKEETEISCNVSSSAKTQIWEYVKFILTCLIISWILAIITFVVVYGSDSDRGKLLNITEEDLKLMVGFKK